MTDVVEMIRAGVRKDDDRRDQIRRDFPECAAMTEQLRAVFGPGVKPLYFSEAGKTMGKQQAFDGTDGDQIIRMSDMDAARNRKANRS